MHNKSAGSRDAETRHLPRLLSISDELPGAVIVVAVTAVLVAHGLRHFLHRHRTLRVNLCLRQGKVVIELNLTGATSLHVVCRTAHHSTATIWHTSEIELIPIFFWMAEFLGHIHD